MYDDLSRVEQVKNKKKHLGDSMAIKQRLMSILDARLGFYSFGMDLVTSLDSKEEVEAENVEDFRRAHSPFFDIRRMKRTVEFNSEGVSHR